MSMTTWLLLAIGGGALLLALHPFVTYPLSLLALRRWRRAAPAPPPGGAAAVPPRFAICTCAYNEARVIEAKLLNLLALRAQHPGLEILVYVDASSDDTASICSRYADRIQLVVSDRRTGKTHGMNQLVARTQADIVVFTDANVMLDPQALAHLAPYFADPDVGCVCGSLVYTNAADSTTARTGSLYWRLEEGIKRLETDTGSVMGADGSLFAIRRALHRPPPDHIIDDMYVSFRVLCGGRRIVQATDVRAYEESVSSMHEEFQRKVRIACQAFNVHRLLWPRLRRLPLLSLYKYVSHKLLRWFTIYLLAIAFVALAAAALVAGWPLAAAGGVALLATLWLLGHRFPVQPVAQLFDILSAMAGAGVGVWRSLLGDRFQTWQPAASIRKP
ncbi:glycosyltransferase family 2 protein [Rubrivivax sp. RP6-9]|uniref:glycosyltransferase family 2 protein n=1 Tax=Rubrivivax sp. RP6-9 TaxID=3415750 RepID=UPI003CC50CFE